MKKEIERNNNILAEFYRGKLLDPIESMQIEYKENDWFVQISKSRSADEDRFTYWADSCITLRTKNRSKCMELTLFDRSGREIHKVFANEITIRYSENRKIMVNWITYNTDTNKVYGSHVVHKPILIDISC